MEADFQFDTNPTSPDKGQLVTIKFGDGFDKIQHTFLIDDVKMLSQEGHSIIIKMNDGDRIVMSFKQSASILASELWRLLDRELKQHLFRPEHEDSSESSSGSSHTSPSPQDKSEEKEPDPKQLRRTIGTIFHLKKTATNE